jgi:hypothetical protein
MTLIWRPGYITTFADPDVQAYLTAVEEADNASLEYPVAYAIDEFVRGCKADGIWSAIKASCILAGARTLAGALVPLVGAAPTNPFVNPANESLGRLFVSGDYNRKTGLVGDGSTKYLNSNRNNNDDPLDNQHLSVYVSTQPSSPSTAIGARSASTAVGDTIINLNVTNPFLNFPFRSRLNDFNSGAGTRATTATGLIAITRNSSSTFTTRISQSNEVITKTSAAPGSANFFVFARGNQGTADVFSNARLAFYSIGESLDLALLDARVTDLINTFAGVIP